MGVAIGDVIGTLKGNVASEWLSLVELGPAYSVSELTACLHRKQDSSNYF